MSSSSDLPKRPDGQIDTEAAKALFMASPYLDWTRFAEKQGWHALQSRARLPVATWQREKRDEMVVRQMDILTAMVFEQKFKWTHEILKTLEDYLPAIDMGLQVSKAKLSQMADMFKDYTDNFRGKPDMMFYKNKRRYHPFEKLNGGEIAAVMGGIKSLTEARLKALMLDKWSVSKLDLPLDEIPEAGETGSSAHRITVEGHGEIKVSDLQRWWDQFYDKPSLPPAVTSNSTPPATSNEQPLVQSSENDS